MAHLPAPRLLWAVPSLALAALLALTLAPRVSAHEEPSTELRELSARMQHTATVPDLLRRAELYALCEDHAGAERDLKQVAAREPHSPHLALAWASLDLARGKMDAAQRRITRVLAERPDDPPALLLAARIAGARHDDALVARHLERAIALLPAPSPDAFLTRAAALESLGRADEALRTLSLGIDRLGAVTSLVLAAARLEARQGSLHSGLDRLEQLTPQFEQRAPLHALRQELVSLAIAREPGANVQGLDDSNHLLSVEAPPSGPARRSVADGSYVPMQPAVFATLVPLGATWRFDTTGVALDTGWTTPGHDDTAWPQGPAPLGFGETYIATQVKPGPDASTRYPTVYFRRTFSSPGAGSSFSSMVLNINYDDGFVAYLNGTEIARQGIAAGAVNYGTLAVSHEAGIPEMISVTAALPVLAAGDNVLAIEVHQTNLTSSDLVLDAELRADNVPLLTRGPYLQIATPTSILVRWGSDPASASAVRFGTSSGARNAIAIDTTVTTDHVVLLTGLLPGTRYWYTPATLAEPLVVDTTTLTFVTAPPVGDPKPARFWIIGDSGQPGPNQNAVRDAYLARTATHPADAWLMLGDNAYTVGTGTDYQNAVFGPYREQLRTTPLWPTRGNHDFLYAGLENDYYDLFTLPTAGEAGGLASGTEAYYSFDYGDVHVTCLDSEGTTLVPGSAMLTWLTNDLAATARKWRIAFWHHPPYTKGSHDSDNDIDSGGRMGAMRANVLPILEAAGVDLVLSGHSHSYERSVLLDEHYGSSSTIADSMKVNAGDGRPSGNGAYEKPTPVMGAHEGAVYSVVGSSAQVSGGPLNHAAMKVSLNVLGSMILDIDGNRLEAQFVDNLGAVRDSFVILKGQTGPHTLTASAQVGGTISPAGPLSVPTNAVETYTITPASTHGVTDVIVDGISKGPRGSWTFTNVQADHTIEARFAPAEPVLKSIRDVAGDQGGSFTVQFRRSSRENAATSQPVTSYEAYRAVPPEAWELVATLPATGDSVYSVAIPTAADSGSAPNVPLTPFTVRARTATAGVFWDSAVDSGYSVNNLAPVAVELQPPSALSLAHAVPNPVTTLTRIGFALPREAHVRLTLYDVSGRVVRRLLDASHAAGAHEAVWDGRDELGHAARSAIYFYELKVEGRVLTGRLVKAS